VARVQKLLREHAPHGLPADVDAAIRARFRIAL
jgi:hypothetical protein